MEEIARTADLAAGTLYRHFPDRQALLGLVGYCVDRPPAVVHLFNVMLCRPGVRPGAHLTTVLLDGLPAVRDGAAPGRLTVGA